MLAGGIGWLSSEYGLASDPHNMLDAQIVKINGDITWASEEPDILWALRGGGGGFAGNIHRSCSVSKLTKDNSGYCVQAEGLQVSYVDLQWAYNLSSRSTFCGRQSGRRFCGSTFQSQNSDAFLLPRS